MSERLRDGEIGREGALRLSNIRLALGPDPEGRLFPGLKTSKVGTDAF